MRYSLEPQKPTPSQPKKGVDIIGFFLSTTLSPLFAEWLVRISRNSVKIVTDTFINISNDTERLGIE